MFSGCAGKCLIPPAQDTWSASDLTVTKYCHLTGQEPACSRIIWLVVRSVVWLFDCLVCWSVGRPVGRSVGRLVDWLVCWLSGWLVGWLVGVLVGLSVGLLVDLLVDCLVDVLVGLLVDVLVGC